MKCMVVVNLHETEFLEEVLTVLADVGVLDCVVRQVEAVASHHIGDQLEPTVLGSIRRLFSQDRNLNYLIQAVVDEEMKELISEPLKLLLKEERYAASFWFMPVQDYFYHKGEI
jgi:nitrogen regulatory protein PII-like uncharacterized protein